MIHFSGRHRLLTGLIIFLIHLIHRLDTVETAFHPRSLFVKDVEIRVALFSIRRSGDRSAGRFVARDSLKMRRVDDLDIGDDAAIWLPDLWIIAVLLDCLSDEPASSDLARSPLLANVG